MAIAYRRVRRTEITVAKERRVVLAASDVSHSPFCLACGEGPMVEPSAAARILGMSTRAIYRAVDAGRVHFTEHLEDQFLVCLRSAGALAGGRDITQGESQ